MSRHADPREIALRVLNAAGRGEELQQALHRFLSRSRMSDEDRHLATQLSYGYFRFKGRLEFILAGYVRHRWKKLPKTMTQALVLGAYELLHLDRIPDYATVSWYVQHIKQRTSRQLAGVANAVLRRLSESERSRFQDIDFYRGGAADEVVVLSRYYACPKWIVELWFERFGRESCEALLKASLAQPPIGLRVNQMLPEADTIRQSLLESPECLLSRGFGLALTRAAAAPLEKLSERGQISRQSLAAQEVLLELEPNGWPEPVWDACAGRGGKTGLLRENGVDELWASDMDMKRLQALGREMDRLKLKEVPAFMADATVPAPLARRAGTVLLDAPCTGLGVLSRRPDLKWKRRPDDVKTLADRQLNMLVACADTLRKGGLLIYVTCTVSPEENEGVVRRFLRDHPEFVLDREWMTGLESPLHEFFYGASLRAVS